MVTAQISPSGLYRLKTKDEQKLHQNNKQEKYVKLKILPSSYDEYRMLAFYVKEFLKKFGIEEIHFSGPDELSQYVNIHFPRSLHNQQSIIDFINNLGFWACMDGDIGVIDLADIDLNLLKFVFPKQIFNFKVREVLQTFSDSVTSDFFEILIQPPISDVIHIESTQQSIKDAVDIEIPKKRSLSRYEVISREQIFRKYPFLFQGSKIETIKPSEKVSQTEYFVRLGSLSCFGSFSFQINSEKIASIKKSQIRDSFSDAFLQEHRRELVSIVEGIEYWNDSHAESINSVWFTLEIIEKPIIWIIEGQDTINDYELILELVREKVISLIILEGDTSRASSFFKSIAPEITRVTSMMQAVQIAHHKARSGDAVVFSPACESFDLFENYEDRGRQFKQAVWSL